MPIKKLQERKSLRNKSFIYFTPAIVWGIFILYFSLLPGRDVPPILAGLHDKLVHGVIYFGSAGLIYLGFIRYNFNNPIPRGAIAFTILLCLIFGAGIELLQHYLVANRNGDWNDFIANTAGSVLCVLLFVIFHRVKA